MLGAPPTRNKRGVWPLRDVVTEKGFDPKARGRPSVGFAEFNHTMLSSRYFNFRTSGSIAYSGSGWSWMSTDKARS